jgi:hypothetical protein
VPCVTAFREVLAQWAPANGTRLWQRFGAGQSRVRELLLKLLEPPSCSCAEPAVQTIAHLRAAFPACACPLSAFQARFQTDLLG